MHIQDSVEIKVSPESLYNWLMDFVDNYRAWHPAHVACKWIKGDPFEIGSILYAEEYLGDKLHKLKFKITRIHRNREVGFHILFPASIFVPKGAFVIEPTENGCRFTAIIYYRFGKILSLLVKKEKDIIEQHQREEGQNLKRILEERN